MSFDSILLYYKKGKVGEGLSVEAPASTIITNPPDPALGVYIDTLSPRIIGLPTTSPSGCSIYLLFLTLQWLSTQRHALLLHINPWLWILQPFDNTSRLLFVDLSYN